MAADQQEQEVQVEELREDLAQFFEVDNESREAGLELIKRIADPHIVETINTAFLDGLIATLDEKLSAQMDEILHNKSFQELESTWRGLEYLVENTKFSKPVKIEVLDVTKEELFNDLEEAKKGDGYEKGSGLWQHVYWNAYDKVGGHPYTAIVSDYQFDSSNKDIKLLRHISVLSENAQLPFIGNVSPKFFGEESFENVMNDKYLKMKVKDGARYTAWHQFRNEDRSKYIGLALPRFLGRMPYGEETEPTKNFNYNETVVRKIKEDEETEATLKDKSLWVNASYAMAANMIRSFEVAGWSIKIVGVDAGGRVANLPVPIVKEHGEEKAKVPMEASVGEAKDTELTDMGFMALAHWDRTDYACFFEARSIKRPKDLKDPIEKANDLVSVGMQYNLLVTRIAHFLKYRQLRFVGKNAGKAEIQSTLEEWLSTLVADQPNPQEEVVARKPLRSYELNVHELEDRPGFYQVEVEFRPHIAITGFDIRLKLVAYHSGQE
jgi:type VI secretion system protein ImpC